MSSAEKDLAITVIENWLSEQGASYNDVFDDDKGYYIIIKGVVKRYLPDNIQLMYEQTKP